MTLSSSQVRRLVGAAIAVIAFAAVAVPLAQAKFTIPEGTLATGASSASYATDAHGRQPLTAVDSGAPPDAFERAVNAARRDVLARFSVDSGAPPDAFERAVNIARGDVLAQSDSHERSETPTGPSPFASADDGSLEWVDLSIGVLLGLALAGLGVVAAFGIRGRGRMAHP
jgi:hypothetical protein